MQPTEHLPSDRSLREREFYDKHWNERQAAAGWAVDLAPVEGKESRPQNYFWASWDYVKSLSPAGKRVLEMGCGIGHNSVRLALLGAKIWAFDISASGVENSKKLAEKYGLADRICFSVGDAEKMEYEEGFFDIVYGYGILHHVDVAKAAQEVRRVLKCGGQGVFIEPIEWPIFEKIRNIPLLVKVLPKDGFKALPNVTADERKLSEADQAVLRSTFTSVEFRKFYFLSRIATFIPSTEMFLQKVDYHLLKALPFLKSCAAAAVIVVKK